MHKSGRASFKITKVLWIFKRWSPIVNAIAAYSGTGLKALAFRARKCCKLMASTKLPGFLTLGERIQTAPMIWSHRQPLLA
jgi:hypothetical protein